MNKFFRERMLRAKMMDGVAVCQGPLALIVCAGAKL